MDLTILQAAQMLGKSPRCDGGGCSSSDQATLPLSGGQAAAVERAQDEEVFGLPLYQEVVRELDAAHPAAAARRKALAHLGRGCHRYRGPDKAELTSSACPSRRHGRRGPHEGKMRR